MQAFDRAAIRYRGARAEVNFPVVRRKADADNISESSSNPSTSRPQTASASPSSAGTADSYTEPVVALPETGEWLTSSFLTWCRMCSNFSRSKLIVLGFAAETQMTMCTRSMANFKTEEEEDDMLMNMVSLLPKICLLYEGAQFKN